MSNSEKIKLTELQKVIRDKLYESFPGFYWVIAEISEIKLNNSGHCYLELTDNEDDGNKVTSRARATIWAGKYRILSAIFESITGIPLQAGITILFKATIEYHELYGLSLNIVDIDPKYTVGEIALRREAIIRKLSSEGVLEMNQSLQMTSYPRRIAIISSSVAAGYQDFVNHLSANIYNFVFVTRLFDTTMQGTETEKSVIESLESIASEIDDFDAVAIIRGGGSQADLAWFDNYNIAYLISQFPLPVITGIGHDKDMTVTDIVSWKALKTPTAVADYFISRTLSAETMINEFATRLSSASQRLINEKLEKLALLKHGIATSAVSMLKHKGTQIDYLKENLTRATDTTIRFARDHTERLDKEITHLNPLNVLRRGYSITLKDGVIVRDHDSLSKGDKIITHFEKGTAESIVQKTKSIST
jgi:exodeoxyribonuclease VII large subunit